VAFFPILEEKGFSSQIRGGKEKRGFIPSFEKKRNGLLLLRERGNHLFWTRRGEVPSLPRLKGKVLRRKKEGKGAMLVEEKKEERFREALGKGGSLGGGKRKNKPLRRRRASAEKKEFFVEVKEGELRTSA